MHLLAPVHPSVDLCVCLSFAECSRAIRAILHFVSRVFVCVPVIREHKDNSANVVGQLLILNPPMTARL